MGRLEQWSLALAAVLSFATLAPPALAQTEQQRADARAAAGEGLRAFREGQFQEAVGYFRVAESLVHAPTHVLYMARATAKVGRLVEARELYKKLAREQIPADAPAAFHAARDTAIVELPQVDARIGSVKITVEGQGNAPVKVTMDGVEVPTMLLGIPRPADPGEHTLHVTAPGLRSEPKKITLADAAKEAVVLILVPDPDAAKAAAAPAPSADASPVASAPPPDPAADSRPSGNQTLRIASYAAAGVGVLGVGAGVFFALDSSSKRSDADAQCKGGCPVERRDAIQGLYDDAGSAQTLALVGFIVGGVGLAAGGTLFYFSLQPQKPADDGDNLRAFIGPRGAILTGRF